MNTFLEKFMRLLVINLVCFSLITNCFATMPENQIKGEELIALAKYINSSKKSFKDAIDSFNKIDPKKEKDLNAYLAANPSMQNLIMPQVTVENDSLTIMVDGQKIIFTIYENGQLTVSVGGKNIRPDLSLPFNQMEKKLSKELSTVNQFSLLNLLIPNAYAIVGVVIAALLLAIPVIVGASILFLKEPGDYLVKESEKVCSELKDDSGAVTNQDFANFKKTFQKMSEIYTKHCVLQKDFYEKTCKKIPVVVKCMKGIIEREDKKMVNDSSRGILKPKNSDGATEKERSFNDGKAVQK